jgi:hypothetical protein
MLFGLKLLSFKKIIKNIDAIIKKRALKLIHRNSKKSNFKSLIINNICF